MLICLDGLLSDFNFILFFYSVQDVRTSYNFEFLKRHFCSENLIFATCLGAKNFIAARFFAEIILAVGYFMRRDEMVV